VRMHFAHNTLRTFLPSSITVTVCKFGRKVREVAFFDQGRLRPKVVFLPQCAHLAISQVPFKHSSNCDLSIRLANDDFNPTKFLGRSCLDDSRTILPQT
jgi:hypothetical protein